MVTGQEFDILVRRVATRRIPIIEAPGVVGSLPPTAGKEPRPRARALPARAAAPREPAGWRYVVGTFQVKIPVSNAEAMLLPEENTLAIMKWRLQQMPPSSRWYPVLQRYVGYLAGRVDGLGGDSGSILPSPSGVPVDHIVGPVEREHTGKVCEVLFDCFGDFEGFVLSDCCGAHTFETRQRGIGEIVLRACREQLLLSVFVQGRHEHRIRRLVIRC